MTAMELDERLARIEQEIAIIKAVQGRLTLPPSLLALLWSILIVSIGAVCFVVRLDARVGEMSRQIEQQQSLLYRHVELPWHAAAGEKYKAVDDRVERIDNRLQRIESK